MNNQPIPMRAHHLSRINVFDNIDEFGNLLVQTGYSSDKSDPFVTEVYTFFQKLKDNPYQKILVTAGEADYICERCPKKQRDECVDFNPEAHELYNTAFWEKDASIKGDERPAKKANLEIGKIYSVEQIIKATEGQTKEFKLSLE